MAADIVGGFDVGGAQIGFGGVDHVFDLRINNATRDEVTTRFIGKVTIFGGHTAGRFGPDFDIIAEAVFGEQACGEPIVNIVGVIGDFVSEVGDLGLQRRLRVEG